MYEDMAVPFSNNLACEVCGAALSFPESLQLKHVDYLVCQSFDCRRIINQKSLIPPLLFEAQVQAQKKIQKERQKKEVAKKKYIEEAVAREHSENQRVSQYIVKNKPELAEESLHVVSIPCGLSRQVSLSEERVNQYAEHLKKIIQQVFADDNDEIEHNRDPQSVRENLREIEKRFVENPVLREVSDNICCMCKGGCCTSGKEQAYITVDTIKRYLSEFPEASEIDILDHYLSFVSSETIDGACINQTKNGCVLPKALRSDTCNSFYCDALKSYHASMEDKLDSRIALVIQRANSCWKPLRHNLSNEIISVALVTEDLIQYESVPENFIKEK